MLGPLPSPCPCPRQSRNPQETAHQAGAGRRRCKAEMHRYSSSIWTFYTSRSRVNSVETLPYPSSSAASPARLPVSWPTFVLVPLFGAQTLEPVLGLLHRGPQQDLVTPCHLGTPRHSLACKAPHRSKSLVDSSPWSCTTDSGETQTGTPAPAISVARSATC